MLQSERTVRAQIFAGAETLKPVNWREKLARRWHMLLEQLRSPYRPELHYMRGPGPKWHAKHAGTGTVLIDG